LHHATEALSSFEKRYRGDKVNVRLIQEGWSHLGDELVLSLRRHMALGENKCARCNAKDWASVKIWYGFKPAVRSQFEHAAGLGSSAGAGSLIDEQIIIDGNGFADRPEPRPGAYLSVEQVAICCAYLKRFAKPTKTIRRKRSSYGWKHVVEGWAGTYISNGAFMVAARALGYRLKRIGAEPNAWLNLALRRQEVGPE